MIATSSGRRVAKRVRTRVGGFSEHVNSMNHLILPLAHAGHGEHGFAAGLLHPITGLDHLFAAVAVGLLAYQLGKRATWLLPAVFVAGMLLGGLIAGMGVGLPGVELGIIASLLAVGVAVAIKRAGPLWASASALGIMAIFHGHAHLAEYEAETGLPGYVIGLIIATVALHALGVAVSYGIAQLKQPKLEAVRVIGGLVFAFGVLKLTGLA